MKAGFPLFLVDGDILAGTVPSCIFNTIAAKKGDNDTVRAIS
jgi:hypothetical protein